MSARPPAGPFRLEHDPWGRLVLVLPDGTRHAGVEPVRAFPITEPRRHVSLLDADGKELLAVDRLDDLPGDTRQLLEDELARRHFLPTVRRVVRVKGAVEPITVDAETDRGPVQFTVKAEEDVRRLPGGRMLLVDSHGVRYLIPDVAALDAGSRRQLAAYL